MMGSDLTLPEKGAGHEPGSVRFRVSNLSMQPEDPFGVPLRDISFDLRDGEIFGVGGLAGNGQTELMDMLSGERLSENADVIVMEDKAVGSVGPGERRDLGLGFVPEERLGHGAVPDMTLWENGFLSAMRRQKLLQNGFIKVGKSVDFAVSVVHRFKVKTTGVDHNASSLSGGNLQKFIVGREIEQNPRVLIVLQPTWGVDAGSAAAIHQELMDLAAKGTAVLVISQDLDELFAVSDRISVMCEGRLSASTPAAETTVEQIGLLMGGLHHQEQAQERAAS